ncbi:MAG: ABC transporter ATP-binding protein [bacterium]|nr:ABC transporter ATP-binding protein [bacterium]
MFEASGIWTGYEDIDVIKGLDFTVGEEVFAILGANGAGKTTLLSAIAGLLPLTSGSIRFNGETISDMPPWRIAAMGVGLVPQERGVFPDLTVLDNLRVGGLVAKQARGDRIDEIMELFPALAGLRNQRAGTLSGGETKMVAAGRALMQDAKLLLMDEPTAGLAPLYVENFFDRIRRIHETKQVAIIITEQNATKALEVADRAMVLSLGEAMMITDAKDLTTDQLRKGYKI